MFEGLGKKGRMLAAALTLGASAPTDAKEVLTHETTQRETLAGISRWTPEFIEGYWKRLSRVGYDTQKLTSFDDRAYAQEAEKIKAEVEKMAKIQFEADADRARDTIRIFKSEYAFFAGFRAHLEHLPPEVLSELDRPLSDEGRAQVTKAFELIGQIYQELSPLYQSYPNLDSLARDIIGANDWNQVGSLTHVLDLFEDLKQLCKNGVKAGSGEEYICARAFKEYVDWEKQQHNELRYVPAYWNVRSA